MGYITIHDIATGEPLKTLASDDYSANQARKAQGLAHYNKKGRWVSEQELQAIDSRGE